MAREVLHGPRCVIQTPHHALCRQTAGAGPGRGACCPPTALSPDGAGASLGNPAPHPLIDPICEPRERYPQSTYRDKEPRAQW